jgi:hypothetical protein
MAEIVYKSLSSLSPIELKYQFFKDEKLNTSLRTSQDGFTVFSINGLNRFQDVTINRDSLFILTSAVNLSTVFVPVENFKLGQLPGTIQIQPRNSFIYYIKYHPQTNTFKQALTSGSNFYIQPVPGTREVEIFVDNKFIQVEEKYPYTVILGDRSLDPESINRQRFEIVYNRDLISFKTLTNSGYRYLALNNDNILRAVGLVLNDTVVNDYIFKCIPVTDLSLNKGFIPANNWVTYFFDIESKVNNKTVELNKVLAPTPTNLLIDLPVEKAAASGKVNINIANLKTSLTPSGGPAPVNNAYEKQVITSN